MKKYLISFFVGILIFGLGIGISFAEVLSFEYKGEKSLSESVSSTKEHIMQFTGNEPKIAYDEDIKASVIVDNNMKNNEIKLEITYNEQYEELDISEYNNETYVRLFTTTKYVQDLLNSMRKDLKLSNTYIYKKNDEKSVLKIYINEQNKNKLQLSMITNF